MLTISKTSLMVREYFGTFYLFLGLACVIFLLVIAISPYGKRKLGKNEIKPEYSLWAWTSMLFSAGMGAGIILRAVQEPVYMMQNPPYSSNISKESLALEYTFYHWGFTPWAMYGVYALIIGYFIYNRKFPVLISSVFKDISKRKSVFLLVNSITVITTVIGAIAAITLGVTQITGGLNHLLSSNNLTVGSSILILLIISFASLFSAFSGVSKGIKIISKFNIILTLSLLAFVFLQSDMVRIIERFLSTFYHYIIDFIPMSLAIGKYDPGKEFLTNWTYFYWAFWLAWAPFTGVFIARISKGRTIREFVIAVLLIPSIGTFIWFTTFGESAFAIIENWNTYNNEYDSVFTSIFLFLKEYPIQSIINGLVVLLLFTFLITSMDSAIYVLSMFTDKGKENPNLKHRLIWGIFLPIFGITFLILGNTLPDIDLLSAISKLLIITSLPFAFITVIIAGIFIKNLVSEN